MKRFCFIILFCILVAFSIVFSIHINLNYYNVTPARNKDYSQLETLAHNVSDDHLLLLSVDHTLKKSDESIYVDLENDECMISVTYDMDFNLLSIQRFDKQIPLFGIVSSIFVDSMVLIALNVIIFIIIIILIDYIIDTIKRHKNRDS